MLEEKSQTGVQSLEVGLTVLNCLIGESQPLMLKTLAEKLSMHPAKVHRYLVSLLRMGYAKQLTDGRYSLGDQAWRLGLTCIQRSDALQLAQPYVQQLQQQIDCGLQISKWSAAGPVIVQCLESRQAVSVITRVGSYMPLLNSATGRIYAAYMPEHLVRPLLEHEWSQAPLHGPKNWSEFLALKAHIQNQGFSSVEGELLAGVNAVCVPVFNQYAEIEFAIAALDSSQNLPIDPEHATLKAMLSTAQQLTKFLSQAA